MKVNLKIIQHFPKSEVQVQLLPLLYINFQLHVLENNVHLTSKTKKLIWGEILNNFKHHLTVNDFFFFKLINTKDLSKLVSIIPSGHLV